MAPKSGINPSYNQYVGIIYNMGGVWFDEVTIVKKNPGGFANAMAMCIGNAKSDDT